MANAARRACGKVRVAAGVPARSAARAAVALAALLLAACAGAPSRPLVSSAPARLQSARLELPEDQLLDVGIDLFDPGTLSREQIKQQGIRPATRKAESRFIPVHLKYTLQKTGYWGAVRVLPPGADNMDVRVRGRIEQSDGEVLRVLVEVSDSSGRRWFSKFYQTAVAPGAYADDRRGTRDAFQDLYNTIANDMAAYRRRLDRRELGRLRQVTALRFAADLAPDAFAGDLAKNPQGRYVITHLPATGDPMYARVQRIRDRDQMLIDTVNGYYDNFYTDLWDPYQHWRKSRSEEAATLRDINREANQRKLLGAAAIAGAIALQVLGNRNVRANTSGLSTVMAVGGAMAIKSGFDKAKEGRINADAIRELGDSFDTSVKPMNVEVQGRTVKLTGSAETQYAEWRGLLRKIYTAETGLVTSDAPPPDMPPAHPGPAPEPAGERAPARPAEVGGPR